MAFHQNRSAKLKFRQLHKTTKNLRNFLGLSDGPPRGQSFQWNLVHMQRGTAVSVPFVPAEYKTGIHARIPGKSTDLKENITEDACPHDTITFTYKQALFHIMPPFGSL